MRTCQQCRSASEEDSNFCIFCGELMRPVLICPECKSDSPDSAHYCYQCGSPLPNAEHLRKQKYKFIMGLILLGTFCLILGYVAFKDMTSGRPQYSTKDGGYRQQIGEQTKEDMKRWKDLRSHENDSNK